jgi:hypothetical protein
VGVEELLALDAQARRHAQGLVKELVR